MQRLGQRDLRPGAARNEISQRGVQAYIHFADGTGAHFCAQGAHWYTFSLVGTMGLALA